MVKAHIGYDQEAIISAWMCSACVRLFAAPRTVTPQAPLAVGFPRQETGLGCRFLLQGIFLTQRSNLSLLHLLLAGRFLTS